MISIKIHDSSRIIVALADSNLIGKKFSEDIREIEINPHFFKGDEKEEKEIIEILKEMESEDAAFNIVGEESIKAAIDAGIIKEEGIITIDNIPIALKLL